ncbi:MAG: putative MATE efflux family protein subfamily [Linnemannia elongata]|nr:MAG: putative MATE efflux family protein subfamily [Linnemannia elongata]
MSSFPKHSFEQAYDHAFPPSPVIPAALSTISERSPLISKAPLTTGSSSNENSSSRNTLQPGNSYTSNDSSTSYVTAKSNALAETDALLEYGLISGGGDHPYSQQQQHGRHSDGVSIRSNSVFLAARELTAREFKILLKYSGPVVLTYILQNSLQMASLVSLGHLGSIELAASSLASMFAAVSCWSVSLGTATALDTLCSQSFTSHHPHMLGIHLQRAILVLMLLFIPISGVWLSSEHIFSLLGQEPELSRHAALFLKGLLPGAPAFLIFECVKKYLQAQGNMHASTYVLLIASPLNVVLNYTLVWNKYVGLGYIGAPIATSISYWNMLILLLLYIRFVDGRQGWGGWSRDAFTGWPTFLKLAIPGVMMVCTEWWAFEVVSLAASYLGTVNLAAQSVVVQTSALLYTIPFGVSIAASNRVGNLIGKGDHRSAKIASRVSLALAIIFGMFNSTMLLLLKDSWGRLFSDDVDVVRTVAMVLPLVALFQISDGIAGVAGGVLRGVGLQHLGAYLNLIAYYIVAFPIGYVLTFKLGYGLKGLWSALCLALWMVSAGEFLVIVKTNWPKEVEKCKARNDLLAKRRASLQAEIDAEFPDEGHPHSA